VGEGLPGSRRHIKQPRPGAVNRYPFAWCCLGAIGHACARIVETFLGAMPSCMINFDDHDHLRAPAPFIGRGAPPPVIIFGARPCVLFN
jgi:hypothetical protein